MIKRLRHFLSSMVGRLFVILLLGMSVAAIGATMLATSKRQQEFERQNLNREMLALVRMRLARGQIAREIDMQLLV